MAKHGKTLIGLMMGLALLGSVTVRAGALDSVSTAADEIEEDDGVKKPNPFQSPPEIREIDQLILAGQYKLAVEKLRPLAEQGSSIAQYKLGGMYEYGLGVDHNLNKAIQLYQESIKGNYPKSHYRLGSLYMNSAPGLKNYCTNAKYHLTRASAEGVKEASLKLAMMFAEGIVCPIDFRESMIWYKKAAEQGSHRAQNHLGDIYYKGVPGYPPSKSEARGWYQKAAEQGNPYAMYSLALMMINGQGDVPDVPGGCKLLEDLLSSTETPDSIRTNAMDSKSKGCASR